MERIVDPSRFLLLGGLTDWSLIYKQHGGQHPGNPAELARKRGLKTTQLLQLRWLSAKQLGYPSAPFTVWRRPAGAPQAPQPVPHQRFNSPLGTYYLLQGARPQVYVELFVQGTAEATLQALGGAPGAAPVAVARLGPTTSRVTLSATRIVALFVPWGWTITQILGLDDSVAEAADWEPIESVGLPVDASWSGIGGFGVGQGFVGNPVDPAQAAYERFQRGAPLFGWFNELRPGVPAPPWVLADPKAMLETLRNEMLPDLRAMVSTLPPAEHATFRVDHTLPSLGGNLPAVLHHHPLESLLYGAATDGLVSLVAGYGTAFEEALLFDDRHGSQRVAHDYMVTAMYKDGTGPQPGAVEYAAILYAPTTLGGVPAPANLASELVGLTSPPAMDGPWSALTRIGWDALSSLLGPRVGAFAFAREGIAPAAAALPLMRPRPGDVALQPIGLGMPEGSLARRYASDASVALDAAFTPNTVSYAVAHHDVFGVFSPWSNVQATATEPPVEKVAITAARLEVGGAAPGSLCPATLVLEFAWDWRLRSPDRVQIVGRLYPQSALGAAPADGSVAAGLAATLGSPGGPLSIDFAADGSATATVATPGLSATVQYLSADGRQVLATPPLNPGPRRYRVQVNGFNLDFDAAGRQGMALWARAREARAPGRLGPWPTQPVVASTADPRPPIVVNTREFVQLTSLADSDGLHHAVLDWPASPAAVGYFAYTCAEARFLSDRGLGPPGQELTLEARLRRLRDAFEADPDRRSFARVNATPIAATRMPIVLPRGTKEIHLFVVIGLSAGQIESAWPAPGSPGLRLAFAAYAAPQLKVPEAPTLEVTRSFDPASNAYRALVRVRSTPGARVARIDLHRVRVAEAAESVESMGPAIAQLSGSSGGFVVAPTVSSVRGEAQAIGSVRGLDDVAGSWKTVYYRAVAWSGDDSERGLVGGRSSPSALRLVVVPPASPPALELPTWAPAGPGLSAVRVETALFAPLHATALGVHRLSVEALAVHADGSSSELLRYPAPLSPADPDADRLDRLGEVPASVWHGATTPTVPGEPGRTPIYIAVPRASFDDAVKLRIRLSDPLGRLTEHLLEVPAGGATVVQPPDILDPDIFSIAGRGRFLTFATTVPETDSEGRPYLLHLSVGGGGLVFPPQPRLRVDIALGEIRLIRSGESLAGDPSPIPLGRTKSGGRMQISALLRSAGSVAVILEAPDGTTATWNHRQRSP